MEALFQKLRCKECGRNDWSVRADERLYCATCETSWPIKAGVPILVPAECFQFGEIHEDPRVNLTDELNWKRMQIRHMEQENAKSELWEFELGRPSRYGRFYEWMHSWELHRAVQMLRQTLDRKEVLVVCSGRGMDAEVFWKLGAIPTCLDISPSSLSICKQRFARLGTKIDLLCNDAESLPFADGSFDYCIVYDGLHHLPHPYQAVAEMSRVARSGVIIIEPHDSWLVRLSRKLGTTTEFEDSGNLKHYFRTKELVGFLQGRGYSQVGASYRLIKKWHYPPSWMRLCDRAGLFQAITGGLQLLTKLAGPLGNRGIFVAVRPPLSK